MTEDELRGILTQRMGPDRWEQTVLLDHAGSPRQVCVVLRDRGKLIELMTFLRDDPRLAYCQLADLTAVDYLCYPDARERFGVVYMLSSYRYTRRLWVKLMVDEGNLTVPSVCGVWPGAQWPEREVYDMFGIEFAGHPDLRRILTPEGFTGFPLRKDYPLRGLGERDALATVKREDA